MVECPNCIKKGTVVQLTEKHIRHNDVAKCPKCQEEFYRLPTGQWVDRSEWVEKVRDWQ